MIFPNPFPFFYFSASEGAAVGNFLQRRGKTESIRIDESVTSHIEVSG
jgi:hypothetical protein